MDNRAEPFIYLAYTVTVTPELATLIAEVIMLLVLMMIFKKCTKATEKTVITGAN